MRVLIKIFLSSFVMHCIDYIKVYTCTIYQLHLRIEYFMNLINLLDLWSFISFTGWRGSTWSGASWESTRHAGHIWHTSCSTTETLKDRKTNTLEFLLLGFEFFLLSILDGIVLKTILSFNTTLVGFILSLVSLSLLDKTLDLIRTFYPCRW